MKEQNQTDKNLIDKAYFWNTIAGLLNAGQSFFFMVVITRSCGLTEAGIFSYSFANASLLLCIGKYGMKKFQATDLKEEYIFSEYFFSRVITTSVMLICIIFSVLFKNEEYSLHKSAIIIIVGLIKMVDSFDDVFICAFQQKKQLDIGARNSCFRNSVMLAASILIILITRNMLLGLTAGFILSVILLIYLNIKNFKNFNNKKNTFMQKKNVIKLLWVNFPLVVGDFLTVYIMNSPKYAIDKCLTEEMQAIYGIIAMPITAITLFSEFAFNPVLVTFSECWIDKNKNKFIHLFIKQIMLVFIFTAFTLFIGYWIGIPILTMIYGIDITFYKKELMLLLLGGGLTAIYSFLYSLTVCIRQQKAVIPVFGSVALIVVSFSTAFISNWELMGAVLLYISTAGLLMIAFGSVIIIKILGFKSLSCGG